MLIGDGVLSIYVLAAGWLLTAGLLYLALRKFAFRGLAKTAMFGAIFFLVSLTRLSVGPWSVHVTLPGLLGLTLGWQSVPVIFICLGLQSLLFPLGGLAALGVNTPVLGLPALLAGLLFSRAASREGRIGDAASFVAGFLATAMAAFLLCASLALSGTLADARVPTLLGTGFLLAALEGLITVFAMRLLRRAAPDMLLVPPAPRFDSDPPQQ